MAKKTDPPIPKLATYSERQEAAAVLVKAYEALRGQAWLACDIPVMGAAMTLALHQLALLACPGCGFEGSLDDYENVGTDDNSGFAVLCPGCAEWLHPGESPKPIPSGAGQKNMFDEAV